MRYITLWRKAAPTVLDWDFHVSEDPQEVERTVVNLKGSGVHQYHTYELGLAIAEHSSTY